MSGAPDPARAAEQRMRDAGMPGAAIADFLDHLGRLRSGDTGTLPTAELEPVRDVPRAADLPDEVDREALDRTVVVKLNGGLGTSMGMTRAKSLVQARDGLSFLDLIARQTLAVRRRHGVRLPLVLMNSPHTRADSLRALDRHPALAADVPADFLQHRVPKIGASDLRPVRWPASPELEWCPPGHGDLYVALSTSGMLDRLLERGYEHAFVSNADNLGAVVEPRIVSWLAAERVAFAMEVVVGTEADRKGGHIARRDGRLVLRETAQTPPEDADSFRDVGRWRFYNTNNLWIHLPTLAEVLGARDGGLGLPLIVNRKTVDPADPESPDVIQLETAMGAAIGVFDGARAIGVPRSRFAPVKTTDDLLVLRSDVYELADDARVLPVPGRGDEPPFVELDPAYFRSLTAFEARFPAGPPSLAACDRLVVRGDVTFGAGVVARGAVTVDARGVRRHIDDGTVLEGGAA